MMILFKECEVFAPEPLGRKDVLVAGPCIAGIADTIDMPGGIDVDVIAAGALRMIPGLIDGHVHVAGAGGEGGPRTRTPEMRLAQMLDGGITTVIGCLGADGMTRSVESVLMKTKALRDEGVSAWMYTGAYQVPTPTILGDVGRDVAMIDEVIGAGEVAIADHRSSHPSVDELIRLAAHARMGGMLGGKAGIVNVHMGDAKHPFQLLYDAVSRSELQLSQFFPTHCNRNHHIFEDAKIYGKAGTCDITASSYASFPEDEIKPSRAIVELVAAGVPLGHITMSSDACGSLPSFDGAGRLVRLACGEPRSIFDELMDTVRREGMLLEQALPVVTANVADILKLQRKGRIRTGHDADLALLDADDHIHHLVAMGAFMVRDGVRVKLDAFGN